MGSQQQLLRDIRVPHSSLRQHTTAIYYRKFLFSLHHTWFHGSRTKPPLNEITMRGQGRIGIGDRPREKWRRSRSSEFFIPFHPRRISRAGCRSKSVDSQVSVDLFFSFSINLLERGGESKRRRANGSLLKLSPIVPVPLINKPFFV